MADVARVVVVGGGLAGAKTVEALREKGFQGSITILGAEPHAPYERPPLSKGYLQGKEPREKAFVHPLEWYAEQRIDLRLATSVEAIDLAAHEVGISGDQKLPYDRLVLATGSSPRRLDVPGADLDGVLYLRSIDDSERLHDVIAAVPTLAIIGGGWIGLEVAAAAREAGVSVTVLEYADLPLQRVLGDEVARVFADLHRAHAVDLRTGVRISGLAGEGGHVTGVILEDGATVPAAAVLVGVGITPDVQLAEAAGLAVDDGVLVDEHLRTSDPDVYAVGDVANAWHPVLGRRIRVEHWANALNQPAVAAANILGGDAAYDRLPYFFSDQYDLGMEYVGYVAPGEHDEVVFRGDVAEREFLAFWLREGRVLAGMNVNVWDVTDDVRALILSGRSVDRARLADPEVPLDQV